MDYATARMNMIESQLRTNKVTAPRLIEALKRVGREDFVPERSRAVAYADCDVPLGGGRFLLAPMLLARLLQIAGLGAETRGEPGREPGGREHVLVVGCATGYDAAVLSHIVRSVVAIDSDQALCDAARANLAAYGVKVHGMEMHGMNNAANADRIACAVTVACAPMPQGYPDRALYDVILISGAVAVVPGALLAQLADGGRLVTVIRGESGLGQGSIVQKTGSTVSSLPVFDTPAPFLPGFAPSPGFVF